MTDKAREAIERVRDLSKYPAYKHNNLEQWATELEIDSKTLADEAERLEAEHKLFSDRLYDMHPAAWDDVVESLNTKDGWHGGNAPPAPQEDKS